MLTAKEEIRYSRQLLLPEIGRKGQERLANAKVLVIGAGGLGCPVLQYLAAAGVGTIGIADGDRIEAGNLQRQVLYTEKETGLHKALVAQEKLQAANPHIQVSAYPFMVTPDNMLMLAAGYDIIVDGTDNFASRYLINDACVLLNKPWVFGSIFRFEGQVSVFNYMDGPTYRCIFPLPPAEDESLNCSVIGVISTLPGIIGSLQANEVIKMITGAGDVLSGRLLVTDVLTMNMQVFHIDAVAGNKDIRSLQTSYEDACIDQRPVAGDHPLSETLISYAALQQLPAHEIYLVDVREPAEHRLFNIGGINIPLAGLDRNCLPPIAGKSIVLYCASGARSGRGVALLAQKGIKNVRSLQYGISGLPGYR